MEPNYIEFYGHFNEESNKGHVDEIEHDYENHTTNTLRTLEFEKNRETGTVTITGMEVSKYCDRYFLDSTVTIPEEILGAPVTAIADYAANNTSTDVFISAVTLSKTLKSVGKAAFADMCEFETIEIPASVTEIGEYAFGYLREEAKDGTESYEKIDDFVISCYPGTAGEKYAKDNGFEYKLLTDK